MKRQKGDLRAALFLYISITLKLDELDTKSHHEHILLGGIDIGEIKCITQSSIVQSIKHLAETKIVINVKSNKIYHINANTCL